MRYPTNVKLLWESAEWSYKQLKFICKRLKIRMPRNKYEEQWDKYNNYSHKRKRTHKETTKRTRSLLYLLGKILVLLKEIEDQYQQQLDLPKDITPILKSSVKFSNNSMLGNIRKVLFGADSGLFSGQYRLYVHRQTD